MSRIQIHINFNIDDLDRDRAISILDNPTPKKLSQVVNGFMLADRAKRFRRAAAVYAAMILARKELGDAAIISTIQKMVTKDQEVDSSPDWISAIDEILNHREIFIVMNTLLTEEDKSDKIESKRKARIYTIRKAVLEKNESKPVVKSDFQVWWEG